MSHPITVRIKRMAGSSDLPMPAKMSGQAAGNYVHESAIFSLLPYVPAVIGMMLLGRWLKGRSIEPVLPLETKPV